MKTRSSVGLLRPAAAIALCLLNSACVSSGAFATSPTSGERIGVTAYAGSRIPLRDPVHREDLEGRGYEVVELAGAAPVASVSLRTQLSPDNFGEVLITRDLVRSRQRYHAPDAPRRMYVEELETTAMFMLNYKAGPVRWGAGAGMQATSTQAWECTSWPWATECGEELTDHTRENSRIARNTFLSVGAIGSINVPLPETRRFYGDVRVAGRWFLERSMALSPGTLTNRAGPSIVLEVGGGWRTNW